MLFLDKKKRIFYLLFFIPFILNAQSVKIITNHVGYEDNEANHAIILSDTRLAIPTFSLIDANTRKVVYKNKTAFSASVDKWKNWLFWTLDFTGYTIPGTYKLQVTLPSGIVSSYPFIIGKNVLKKFLYVINSTILKFKYEKMSNRAKCKFGNSSYALQFCIGPGRASNISNWRQRT